MTASSKTGLVDSVDWRVTGLIVILLLGGGFFWRTKQSAPANSNPAAVAAKPTPALPLARTQWLVGKKLKSIEAYNQASTPADQFKQFTEWSENRQFTASAFNALSGLMVDQLIPDLWREAQQQSGNSRLVTHSAMAAVIQRNWPQHLLPEGHVVLFPHHPQLRRVVSEYRQDYFRDTGWHWKWIGQAINQGALGDLTEMDDLDTYAAEELSEFLSVLAVAMMEWAGESQSDDDPKLKTDERVMRFTIANVYDLAPDHAEVWEGRPAIQYSALSRQSVLDGIIRPMFKDITAQTGLDFVHSIDPKLHQIRVQFQIFTGFAGGGVSAGDFNSDGLMDFYFAGNQGGQLWRGAPGGKFEKAPASTTLNHDSETRAGYFVDYDNDGDLDLFVTHVRAANHMYRNDGGGRLVDVTEEAGLGGGRNVTHEAVWFDYDRDGLLDIYVANFGLWPAGIKPDLQRRNYSAPPNQLYHHRVVDGRHVFEEVAAELGVNDKGWTHCVGAWDFDQDGWVDLMSLNDFGQTMAYRNVGGKKFVEETRTLHLDTVHDAMNFSLLDLNHSGQLAVYISQIAKLTHRVRYLKPTAETKVKFDSANNLRTLVVNKLLQRVPSGAFEDVHGIYIEPAPLGWAWGASVTDYQNDGHLDMLILNGTETKKFGSSATHELMEKHGNQRNVFFLSRKGYFYDVSPHCELAFTGNSRGSAWVDLDNDGDLDVIISNYQGPARVFENLQTTKHQWIRFKLEGTRSNRNAIDARVEVRFGGQKRFDQVVSGKGFLSQNPMALHFGLGEAKQVEKVIVTWPTGKNTEHGPFAAGRLHRITEPTDQ